MASDEHQLDNENLETLPTVSDEYRQEPPLPPPPSPPSLDDRDGMAVLDHFMRLVGKANALRPGIEGTLAQFADIRFWEERIRGQTTEKGDPPEPPDEELLYGLPGLDSRVSEAIGMLPRLVELRSRYPDICGVPTHAEVGAALEDFARQVEFCWRCLHDEGETIAGSPANPFQQTAQRFSNGVARTYQVLDATSNGLMILQSIHTSYPNATPIMWDPVSGPSVPVAADPIPVPIPESPDWFFTKVGKNKSWVTITAFDGKKETFYLSRKPALLVERLNQGRSADGGWVTNDELRAAIGETENTLDPMRFFHGTREAERHRFFKICGDTSGCRRKLVRPASFE